MFVFLWVNFTLSLLSVPQALGSLNSRPSSEVWC